jgi:AraC-like DNA-binding protein
MNIPVCHLPEPAHSGLFISAGWGIHPTRVIDTHELIFVRSGCLGMFEEEDTFEVHSGEALLLQSGRRHGGTTPYTEGLSFYWVHFRLPKAGRGKQTQTLDLPRIIALRDPDILTEWIRRYLNEQNAGRLDDVSGGSLLLLMFAELARSAQAPPPKRTDSVLAERAWQYLTSHAHLPISTAHVAKHLRCNPDYLGRIFHATHGCSIIQAIHRFRIQQAKAMLINSVMNVEEIARASGFTEACYFRRVFKQHTGVSPRQFRSQYSRVKVNVY